MACHFVSSPSLDAETSRASLSTSGVVPSLRKTRQPSSCTAVRRGRFQQLPAVRAVSERERVVAQFSRLAGDAAASLRQVATQTEKAFHGLGSSNELLQQQTQATAAELRAQADLLRRQALVASARLAGALGRTEEERASLLRQGSKVLFSAAGELRTRVLTAPSSMSSLLQEAEKKKGLLLEATKGAPEPIREIAETAVEAHSEEKARKGAVIHDFCLGITYGGLLVLGGLLWFLVSGSINAVRFGVLLGGGVLGAAMASMKAWRANKSSTPYIAIQGALCYALFATELSRYSQTHAIFPTALVASTSIAMVAFYVYVVLAGGNPPSRKIASVDSLAS